MKHQAIKVVLWVACILLPKLTAAQGFESELHLWNPDSETDDTYWYRIISAVPEMGDYAITDVSEEDELCPAQLLQTDEKEHKSQWKLKAGTDGKVILINRGTGQELNGSSIDMGNFNATQIMPAGISSGFTITSLGDYAFKLESVEDDDINRCLAVTDMDALPITYPEENLSTSAIGWKFIPVEITGLNISSANGSNANIRIANKRIYVSGDTKWQLFNAQGEEMPRTIRLATGVYMVKAGDKTVKVLVN